MDTGISGHRIGLPPRQGLYDPQFEHDACGMGFVADLKGRRSHEIVRQALQVLANLAHRGAVGAEANTGDGAGILIQIPHAFFQRSCRRLGFELPEPRHYGVAMVYLPPDEAQRRDCQARLEAIVAAEGQRVLGWRHVPTDDSELGATTRAAEPAVWQLFIARSADLADDMAFERKLYVIRRLAEKAIRYGGTELQGGHHFYIPSISCRTVIYKGMLMPEQLEGFYPELNDPEMESGVALVHSRFSTNTFPSWSRAHPYRYIMHNGEINTLRGNVNWMRARESMFSSFLFGDDLPKLLPAIDPDGSDTAMFDNCLELLALAGRSLPHAISMMIPEPWSNHEDMDPDRRAFYEYHSALMEPWDGPASIGFTDGEIIGAVLDRNGLRPSRYYVTKDDLVVLASEVGVLEIEPERVLKKGRLEPGRMFLVDTREGRIIIDEEIKGRMASAHPYARWLKEHMVELEEIPGPDEGPYAGIRDQDSRVNGFEKKMARRAGKLKGYIPLDDPSPEETVQLQKAFGYSFEALRLIVGPMAQNGLEPVGSMGNSTPLAVLSERPQMLYDYFKQLFAQVTNPPIDAIREELITGSTVLLGSEGNLLEPKPENCRRIKLKTPILTNGELSKLRTLDLPGFKSRTLAMLFTAAEGASGLEAAMDQLCEEASQAVAEGVNILLLSDRGVDQLNAPIPALLAVAGLHHHLIREGSRTRVSLVLESGEPREVHHFATLLGYGASAVNPYMAYRTVAAMIKDGLLTEIEYEQAEYRYTKAAVKGVLKIASKMGISTIQSYCGAQIFEAVGLNEELIDRYFTGTPSRVSGMGLEDVAQEVLMRHRSAFPRRPASAPVLDPGGAYQWRADGEHHTLNPMTVAKLQHAVRAGSYETFKEFSSLVNDQSRRLLTLRGLLQFRSLQEPVPLEEVESVESICRRFKSGAMSYGSISQEAHEALAIAMNRIGGKSNTGEGGEDSARYAPLPNGDSRSSASWASWLMEP